MTHSHLNEHQPSSFPVRMAALLGALVALGIFAAAPASAAYEQVGCFAGPFPGLNTSCKPTVEEKFFEEMQLGGVSAMAVNATGAGGVKPGTVYAATFDFVSGETHVVRYEPDAEGGVTFVESWRAEGGKFNERCGPLVGTTCQTHTSDEKSGLDVEVDQATGNVYVANITLPGEFLVTEYTPDGSAVITRFGEMAAAGETPASSPEKVHQSAYPGEIAVDGSGDVYVADILNFGAFDRRLMVFKPQSPGDYEHYVYAGQGHDLATTGDFPIGPVTDAAGHVYVKGNEYVDEYDPTQPSAPPICHFDYLAGGIYGMTVDPATGEPFFYSYKDRKIHRLSACQEGKFVELESFKKAPTRSDLFALAFDPDRQLGPSRAPGVLYGAAPKGTSDDGSGEPGQGALGYIFAPVKETLPSVESQAVTHVTSTTALLGAQINPEGSQTRYAFRYLTDAAYEAAGDSFAGAAEAPMGGSVLGAGETALSAAATISGLQPDTRYRFRVVATSHCAADEPEKVCEGDGPAQLFSTFPVEAPGLPDDRVWELVSPASKNGGQVVPAQPEISSCPVECKPRATSASERPMQSAPDGDAIVYEGTSPFFAGEGAISENEYIARRTASGWQTTSLVPAQTQQGAENGYVAFDKELTHGLLAQTAPALNPEAPGEYPDLYWQPMGAPSSLSPLLTQAPPDRLPGQGSETLALRYAGASADFSRVFFTANDALTQATSAAPAAVDGGPGKHNLYEWDEGQLRLVNVLPGNTETVPGAAAGAGSAHAISGDGSRVFWSDEAGHVFVRERAEVTREIPGSGPGAGFLAAAADGSEVLLSDGDLYDLETGTSTDLTAGNGGFQGILGQGEDLSHVYFVDTAVLSEEADGLGAKAQAGQDNLYAWDAGSITFVTTLLATDNGAASGDWAASPSARTAEASPNGRWVGFRSTARLTGYDNTGPCEFGGGTGPCQEVFLFDSGTGKLVCASCDPSNVRPLGNAVLRLIKSGIATQLPQPRYLTDSGRLYFDSRDSLSPFDTNNGVEDVYQYEPNEDGNCKRASGCISLISAGHGAADSNFLAVDEDGKNVFFTTRDQLVSKDHDDLIDLYVAHEGGAETEGAAGGECRGEACQGPVPVAPVESVPGSLAFSGVGNLLTSVPPSPSGVVVSGPRARVLTRAQKLARALTACRKKPGRGRRVVCERTARKRYGASAKGKGSAVKDPKEKGSVVKNRKRGGR
jgi:hypothetical protein